jgi:Trk K+ transport system NAD-binding subunit
LNNYELESIDAGIITGSGVNDKTPIEAGAKEADLIISTTGADEVNVLCCIIRDDAIIIPSGETRISMGDDVIIVSKNHEIRELGDILLNGALLS